MRQGPQGPPLHSPPLRNVGLSPDDLPDVAGDGERGRGRGGGPPLQQQHPPAAPPPGAAGGSGPGPAGGDAERLPADDPDFPNAVKVSQSSKIPAVAGKIAHSMRAADWPTLLVAGNSSIQASIRCCITAARFLAADGLVIAFEPRFREADHSRALLMLRVLPPAALSAAALAAAAMAAAAGGGVSPLGVARGPPVFEIKVSTHSRHAKVGAALSARLTELPARAVSLLALGETAVANAVMATAHAAHYLATSNGVRIAVTPAAAVIVKEGEQLSGVALTVTLQPASVPAGPVQGFPLSAGAAGPSRSAGGPPAAGGLLSGVQGLSLS